MILDQCDAESQFNSIKIQDLLYSDHLRQFFSIIDKYNNKTKETILEDNEGTTRLELLMKIVDFAGS